LFANRETKQPKKTTFNTVIIIRNALTAIKFSKIVKGDGRLGDKLNSVSGCRIIIYNTTSTTEKTGILSIVQVQGNGAKILFYLN